MGGFIEMKYRIINCKKCRIRAKGSFEAEVLMLLPVGTVVNVMSKRYGWAHVGQGYIKAEFLEKI